MHKKKKKNTAGNHPGVSFSYIMYQLSFQGRRAQTKLRLK